MKLYIFLTILICLFYIKLTLQKKYDFQIIQTSLTLFKDDLFYEKYPIIFEDNIVNIEELFDSIFKYQYIFKQKGKKRQLKEYKNNNKFLIFHNVSLDESTISIKNNLNDVFVDVILRKNKVLILPYGWYYINKNNVSNFLLNDFIHSFRHFNFY
jgi:hypothetical protein